MLLIKSRAFLVSNKHSESIIIAIHQDSVGYIKTYKLWDISYLLSFKLYLLNNVVLIVLVKVSNVETLLTENLVSKLCESLVKLESFDLSIFLLIFIGDLIRALSSKPLISPLFEVEITMWVIFVIPSLQ